MDLVGKDGPFKAYARIKKVLVRHIKSPWVVLPSGLSIHDFLFAVISDAALGQLRIFFQIPLRYFPRFLSPRFTSINGLNMTNKTELMFLMTWGGGDGHKERHLN